MISIHLPTPELFAVRGQGYHDEVPPASVGAVPVSFRSSSQENGTVGLYRDTAEEVHFHRAVLGVNAKLQHNVELGRTFDVGHQERCRS